MELQTCERKYYQQDSNKPLLFYAVFGEIGKTGFVSKNKYRFEGIPKGIVVEMHKKERNSSAWKFFLNEYIWEEIKKENNGLSNGFNGSLLLSIWVQELPFSRKYSK